MRTFLAVAALSIPFVLAGCGHVRAVYVEPPPPSAAYSQIARQGYRDGIDAARRDINAGRRPDVGRHPRFHKPPVPPMASSEYRRAFRDGYQRAFGGRESGCT